MEEKILNKIYESLRNGEKVALVTMTYIMGSTPKAGYIGMISSKRKVLYVMSSLMDAGVPKEDLEKVYAPMGLNISSETPPEIAFGILVEILLIKNAGSLNHRKDLKKIKL